MYTYLLIFSVWKQNTCIANLDNVTVLLLRLDGGLGHVNKQMSVLKIIVDISN